MRGIKAAMVSLGFGVVALTANGYTWTCGEAETNKVDLLMVFDSSASTWLATSSYTNAAAFAEDAVAHLNGAISATGIHAYFSFRLAGVKEISHSFSKGNPVETVRVLTGLASPTKALAKTCKGIWRARDKAKADIVVVLSDGFLPGMYGNAMSLTAKDLTPRGLATFKERAYCVCDISSVFSRYTLLHEIGHIMGAGHSNEPWVQRPGPQACPFASGFHFSVGSNRYATVMASPHCSSNGLSWARLPVFSSPNHTFKFRDPATGGLVDSGVRLGEPETNDNTRTILETYPYVTNFRVSRKMDNVPVDPDSIRLSVVTNGVDVPQRGVVHLRSCMSHDFKLKVESPGAFRVHVKGLPRGLYYSKYTGRIMGWPEVPGKYVVLVEANNSIGYKAKLKINVVVERGLSVPQQRRGKTSILRQAGRWRHPWHRPEGAYYVLEKPLTVRLTAQSAGDHGLVGDDFLELSLNGRDGAGWVSGSVAGAKISRYVQFERFGAGRGTGKGQERVGCFVSEPPRAESAFKGYMRWFDFNVTVDESWHIKDMSVFSVRKL